ncbi:unnamed protein product [Clonostachys rhizophaga]|uniref:Glycosyl transferase CAP10 domain-containing protein n=1 Tax=Clonostachys rhizophaga TaxID=160324 RepID=A0A9N9YVP7_9HYPO|nr:unnamed protein product [Clonostachys rhizophaga]
MRHLATIDPVTGLAGSAALCAVWTHWQSSRRDEPWAELICWILLPILCKAITLPINRLDTEKVNESRISPGPWLWLFAICVATQAVCEGEQGSNWLLPLLMPLLLVVEQYLGRDLSSPASLCPNFIFLISNTLLGTTSITLFGIFTLVDFNLIRLALSITSAMASFTIYLTLLNKGPNRSRHIPHVDIREDIEPLSFRVTFTLVVVLTLKTITLGCAVPQMLPTMTLGISKAFTWFFFIQTAHYTTWRIAVPITTFSILSTTDPYSQTWDIDSFFVLVGSVLFLSQIIGTIPKHPKTLWVLSLIPIIPYFLSLQAIMSSQRMARISFHNHQMHPVEEAIHAAQGELNSLIHRQSKTYTAARDEYKRRYGLEPPPGFEEWYEFAKTNQSPIIDDFDTIQRSIAPLLKLSGRKVLEAMSEVYSRPGSEVWSCEYSSQKSETRCSHPGRTFDRHISLLFNRLMKDVPSGTHSLRLLVNHFDEPRVLTPSKALGNQLPDRQGRNGDEFPSQIWDMISQNCNFQDLESGQSENWSTSPDIGLVRNHSQQVEICQHPEYQHIHGLLTNPVTFRPIEDPVPVLSTGSLSPMGDILLPSPAYLEEEFQYDESQDTDWTSKHNKLYWAGSTSGGYANGSHWRAFHRHRFVNMVHNPARDQTYWYLQQQKNGLVERAPSSFLNRRLYNVAFTRVFQCEPAACHDQRAHFNVRPWAHKDEALGYRLAFDLDGNGISGRFYKLLASRSVPLKQTIMQEWHDDRLVPWVHYIPVSQDMRELPELITYLTSTKSGQEQARKIAEQGRDWYSKAFREVDMTIYIYRLLLELARLQDPTREGAQEAE